jgi:hypothetical protein
MHYEWFTYPRRGHDWRVGILRSEQRVSEDMILIIDPVAKMLGVVGREKESEFWFFRPVEGLGQTDDPQRL